MTNAEEKLRVMLAIRERRRSIHRAVLAARKLVKIGLKGRRQYEVISYSDHYHAWEHSHAMDYWRARQWAKRARLEIALDRLNIQDGQMLADALATEEGRWDDLLRSFMEKQPL